MNLKQTLITYCSPVFADLKPSYLIMIKTDPTLNKQSNQLKPLLKKNGFRLRELGHCTNVTRYLLFNENSLTKAVYQKENIKLLQNKGYIINDLDSLITQLYQRLEDTTKEFPHEIGIFLGYPYEDTIGFIQNKGESEIYCGYWKVYANVDQTKKDFQLFDKCKENYCSAFAKGCPFEDLIENNFENRQLS